MAIVDYNALLGKRVKLTLTYPNDIFPPYDVFGVFVGFVNFADGYERFSNPNEILFLEDGYDEPDFVNFDHLELIGQAL